MAATDGSSAISERRREDVLIRDGGICVLCGDDPVDVAHIVARKAGDVGQVPFIRNISPLLSGFRKDDPSNLISLCFSHHRQYDYGFFVLVPSKRQRDAMLNHEQIDFSRRESFVASGQPDPGRTFPPITNEIEYIPVHARRFRAYIHNPTRYDETMFIFDTVDHYPCPLLHFQASPICLMIQAQPHLANVTRFESDKANIAETQVTTLLKLYRRQLGKVHIPISIPASYAPMVTRMGQPNSHPNAQILPIIPGSPPPLHPSASPPSMSYCLDLHPEVPGLTPSSSTSTDHPSEGTEVNLDLHAGADPQLLEYAKEPAITWEDLKCRSPLFPGEEGGTWQFSSVEQIIHGEWH